MQHPRATGVIFRRNSKMLTAPGSIWHEAVAMFSEIYPKGLKIRNRDLEIVFPNGALLKFSHMQHESNMYDHKGAQYSLVIFDEATDFTEDMFVYLMSRMRNAYVDYQPQLFAMTNPDYNSFLRTWIEGYYLDSEGIPIDERAGHIRYFFRQNDKMIWGNSEKELKDMFGENAPVTSLTFIGANCDDNPPLLLADPSYKDRLLSLPEVEVKRLYYGSWFARPLASGSWKREWCTVVNEPNINAKKRVRAYDVAGSLPAPAYPDPDWTRGVLTSRDSSGVITVEDMVSLRDRFHKVEELIISTALSDPMGTTVVLPCDPNAQAGAWARNMQRRLGELGINCRLVRPQKSKLMRFAPVSTIAQAGFMQIVNGEWYQDFATELENFDPLNRKLHDDIVDCISDCVWVLNNQQALPEFSLPDLSSGPTLSLPTTGSIPISGLTIPTNTYR